MAHANRDLLTKNPLFSLLTPSPGVARWSLKKPCTSFFSSLLLLLLLPACSGTAGENEADSSSTPGPSSLANLDLPSTRNFHMGFTPFHYSWIEDKITDTYAMINANSDLILHHFDEGVPWPEAYANEPYHQEIENNFRFRRAQQARGQKLFVATTPIDFNREKMAPYWGKKENMDLPKEWRDLELDDPMVIQAYINYCKRLIEEFNPDYFSYGIEVNLLSRNAPETYQRFIALASEVYPALKAEYPDLPIMVSFYTFPPEDMTEVKAEVDPLLPYTDYYAISTYPYMGLNGDSYKADELPAEWFTQAREIAPDKPFAVAETGYIAEDFSAYFNTIESDADEQRKYVTRLLADAQALDAEFVVWFVVADYDELWTVFRVTVMFNPLARAWKDTGLFDGDLNERPGLEVWDSWLSLPHTDDD